MATKIIIKKSAVAGNSPSSSQLDYGELAVNVADRKIFTKDNTGTIVELGLTSSSVESSILAQMREHHIVDMGDWDGVVRIDGGDSDDTVFVTNGSYDGGGA